MRRPRCSKVADSLTGDEATGARMVAKSLEAPLKQIAENAGMEGGVVVEQVRNLNGAEGLNAATGVYEDLVKLGVIDAAKVTRSALQNAASIAALFLTTEAVVADKPEKDNGGGGMRRRRHGGLLVLTSSLTRTARGSSTVSIDEIRVRSDAGLLHRCLGRGQPPATAGMMLTVSPSGTLVSSAVEVADVVVGDEHVDELAQRAGVVEQPLAEAGVRGVERLAARRPASTPSTCTVETPPEIGRMVVGMRTFTAMREMLPIGSGFRVRAVSMRPVRPPGSRVDGGRRSAHGSGDLELRGEAHQQVLAPVGGDELHADGKAVGGHVQRQADRRLAGDVELRRVLQQLEDPPALAGLGQVADAAAAASRGSA